MSTISPNEKTKVLTPKEIASRLFPFRPQLANDQSTIAFEVEAVGYKGKSPSRSIWLSRDGSPAVQFTAGVAVDKEPRWSPDGQRIAFLSNREDKEEFRILLIAADGGEAQQLGELKGDLSLLKWSPTGAELAVLRRQPELKSRKKRNRKRDDAVVTGAEQRMRRLWIVDSGTGEKRRVESGDAEIWDYAWSLDGETLAFVTSAETGEDSPLLGGDIWLVGRDGSAARHLVHLRLAPSDLTFVEGPNGPSLAFRNYGLRDHPADSVGLIPLTGGPPTNLLPDFSGNVEAIAPLSESPGSVAILTAEGVHSNIYALDVSSFALRPLAPVGLSENGAIVAMPGISSDGATIAAVWSDGAIPDEVYLIKNGKTSSGLTTFGMTFAGRLRPTETISWESDGHEIFGLFTLPELTDSAPPPLVVQIHGGPSWQWQDSCFLDWHDWTQMLASRGFAVLTPNPRGSTGRGADFQRLLQDDVGGGESRDIVNGALALVDRGIVDAHRLGIGGWSWGGYLTAFTITQTQMFKAAVMGAGLSNMLSDHGQGDIPSANLRYYPGQPYDNLDAYVESSAIRHITRCATPTLIVHGENDARVHPAQGMEMYRALKVLGVPVEFVRYPREEHTFREWRHQVDLMTRICGWFERWLT